MINVLAARNLLLPGIICLLLTCNQCRSENTVSNAGPTTGLSFETAQSAYDFVNSIGVNTHLNYFDRTYGNFQLVKRELESVGIRHVRDGVHLLNADYNRAVYDRWSQLGSIGIRFDAVLDPRSALGTLTADKLDQIEKLAGDSIESFEGPNELDISNIPDWASVDRDYQKDIYQSVKSMTGAKPIEVLGPSLAFASKGSFVGNISDRLDYGNLHPYPAGKMPSSVFPDQLLLAKEVSGNKNVFITESGYHNALDDHRDQPAVSEIAAGKYIPRLFLENFSQGVRRTYLYEFLDEAPDPGLTNFQMHWGLLRSDGSEKPAFTTMKNLIGELSDSAEPAHPEQMTYSLGTQNPRIHHLFLQRSDGQFFLILWQEVPSYDCTNQQDVAVSPQPVTLTLDHSVRSISTYMPAIQSQPLHVYANVARVSLEVPDHPLVIQITQR
jgi:hypothetical protein